MGQRLILAGGGHAHMMILAHIRNLVRNGHQVTVIQPSDYHYYSGMGPGMLGLTYTADDIRFATRHVVERQGRTFIRDKVTGIDAAGRTIATSSGLTLEYDVLSCNTGSFVPFQNVHGDTSTIFAVKPIERLQEAQRVVISLCASRSTPHIAVVGGGPAAVEIAGNLRRLANLRGRHMPRITLFAGRGLLSKLPAAIRSIARESLARQNIAINEEGYVQEIRNGRFAVGDSEVCPDLIFMATGVRPSPFSKLPAWPRGLRVDCWSMSTSTVWSTPRSSAGETALILAPLLWTRSGSMPCARIRSCSEMSQPASMAFDSSPLIQAANIFCSSTWVTAQPSSARGRSAFGTEAHFCSRTSLTGGSCAVSRPLNACDLPAVDAGRGCARALRARLRSGSRRSLRAAGGNSDLPYAHRVMKECSRPRGSELPTGQGAPAPSEQVHRRG